jgi:hypothetical protein
MERQRRGRDGQLFGYRARRQARLPGHHQRAKYPQARGLGQRGQRTDDVLLFHFSIFVAE